jgi:peptidylprolyl isomerase
MPKAKVIKFVNKQKIRLLLFLLFNLLFFSDYAQSKVTFYEFKNERVAIKKLKQIYPSNYLIKIKTDAGNMILLLYNETPLHRDNFIKLVKNKFYDSLLFHRVIQNFMIQGGDPDSKKAIKDQLLGDGDVGYTIPAEFNQQLFHRKGMLCAAREGDDINPLKASSGCQFYIVQGKLHTDETLKKTEYRINKQLLQELTENHLNKPENENLKKKYMYYSENNLKDSLALLKKLIDPIVLSEYEKTPHYTFNEIQQEVYKTYGGTPHLDNNYTVFGEVMYGLDVIDKIAKATTDKNDRPIENIIMKISLVHIKKD